MWVLTDFGHKRKPLTSDGTQEVGRPVEDDDPSESTGRKDSTECVRLGVSVRRDPKTSD